jgi:hypothetical protein
MLRKIKFVLIVIAIIGLGVLLFYGLLKGFEFLSNLIPMYVSGGIAVLGIVFLVVGKLFLRKQHVYKRISKEHIVLETPLYADLMYIIGVILIGVGLLTFKPIFSLFDYDKVFMAFLVFFLLVLMIVMVIRLIYALDDKIEITTTSIRYDDPITKSSLTIEQHQIIEIIYLKVFSFSKVGYSENNFEFQLFILYKDTTSDEVKVELKPADMNLNLDILIDSLTELSYSLQKRSKKSLEENEWEGHHFIED